MRLAMDNLNKDIFFDLYNDALDAKNKYNKHRIALAKYSLSGDYALMKDSSAENAWESLVSKKNENDSNTQRRGGGIIIISP